MRNRYEYRHLAVGMLAAMALAACSTSSTHLAAQWRDPTAGPLQFHRTIVTFVTKDEALRRTVEDKLAAQIPNATQSYRALPKGRMPDSTHVLQSLRGLGFDGAVVMRVADVDNQITYVSGAYWYGTPYRFGSYWGSSWGYPYDPGYVYEDRVVTVETQIYSLPDDRLIWAGRSETVNPKSAGKLTDSVIKRVVKALREEGLIAALMGDARYAH